MFENLMNCNNSYNIESEQVLFCLKIIQKNLENLDNFEDLENLKIQAIECFEHFEI